MIMKKRLYSYISQGDYKDMLRVMKGLGHTNPSSFIRFLILKEIKIWKRK